MNRITIVLHAVTVTVPGECFKQIWTLDCFAFVIHADGVRQCLQSVAPNGTIVHTSNGINNLHTEFNENLICHSQVIL